MASGYRINHIWYKKTAIRSPGGSMLQIAQPTEDEVKDWAWHSSRDTVDDDVLREIGAEHVSFVFSLHVPGCEVQDSCGLASGPRTGAGARGGTGAAFAAAGRRCAESCFFRAFCALASPIGLAFCAGMMVSPTLSHARVRQDQ